MRLRRVGGSGLQVSILGLGTLPWGVHVDEYVALELLKEFHDAGGTLVDTSPLYGRGSAETMVGAALEASGVRERFVVATRAGVRMRGGQREVDVSRTGLLDQLAASRAALSVDHLDLWILDAWDDTVPVDETLSALAFAVQSGHTRYVGLGGLASWQAALLRERFDAFGTGTRLVSVHQEYSLLDRGIERDTIPAAGHSGAGVFAGAALGRGVLTGKYRHGIPADSRAADSDWENYVASHLASGARTVEAVCRAAEGLGIRPSHVALGWLWAQPDVACAVIGARTAAQLSESLGAVTVDVPEPIVAALDDVSKE